MNKKEMIDDIMLELAYRVSDGTPNFKNENHLYILRQIMEEKKLDNEFIESVISRLRPKQLLNELESFGSPTRSKAVDFDGTYSSGSLSFDFKNPETKIEEPVQDDEKENGDKESEEEDDDTPVKEESYIPTYVFDPDKMGIVETGNTITKKDILKENKFKCFMTGEIYLETKNGTLVKELDYLGDKTK